MAYLKISPHCALAHCLTDSLTAPQGDAIASKKGYLVVKQEFSLLNLTKSRHALRCVSFCLKKFEHIFYPLELEISENITSSSPIDRSRVEARDAIASKNQEVAD